MSRDGCRHAAEKPQATGAGGFYRLSNATLPFVAQIQPNAACLWQNALRLTILAMLPGSEGPARLCKTFFMRSIAKNVVGAVMQHGSTCYKTVDMGC